MLLNILSGFDSSSEFFINSMGEDDRVFIGVEVGMLVSSFGMGKKYDTSNLLKRIGALCDIAHTEGRNKSKQFFEIWLGQALEKGAGAAHKFSNKANALPPLDLVIKKVDPLGNISFISDPLSSCQTSRFAMASRMGDRRDRQLRCADQGD
jgi:hypothetical protein